MHTYNYFLLQVNDLKIAIVLMFSCIIRYKLRKAAEYIFLMDVSLFFFLVLYFLCFIIIFSISLITYISLMTKYGIATFSGNIRFRCNKILLEYFTKSALYKMGGGTFSSQKGDFASCLILLKTQSRHARHHVRSAFREATGCKLENDPYPAQICIVCLV